MGAANCLASEEDNHEFLTISQVKRDVRF